ncbi:hypothetical protein ACFV2N_22555 [Streptomyces sp. NPDC059680]|uniref:hypothetical protein n=1 Tax=Streptomyces sp. NPDC059680 TaxID=3346904 RepID=UPI003691CB1F
MGDTSPSGHEGPLAEFSALRQEIERRSSAAHALLGLQLTTAAVVFSFAAASPGRVGHGADIGLVVATANFTRAAADYAQEVSILIMGGHDPRQWNQGNPLTLD